MLYKHYTKQQKGHWKQYYQGRRMHHWKLQFGTLDFLGWDHAVYNIGGSLTSNILRKLREQPKPCIPC
jgi:hypothetical protein